MNIFKNKRQDYEELLTQPPRRGQHKSYNSLLIVMFVAIAVLLVALIVTGSSSKADSNTVPIQSQSAPGETNSPAVEQEILVDLDIGQLRGKKMVSRGGREYLAFIGVPYAQPPLGPLRFAVSILLS